MRILRNAEEVVVGNMMEKQSSDLEAVEEVLKEWEIQCLILVSFGLQVFLFLAADMRRRSVNRILSLLLWLAYLSADSVAVFVLGHLAVHAAAGSPHHQLLIFWAPFLLLHLGGQDSITAFSMQDNELWTRHLLGLLTQAAVAGNVVSQSSWHDRRLLAATVLMFLCGFFKYIGRTFCLYRARPTELRDNTLSAYGRYQHTGTRYQHTGTRYPHTGTCFQEFEAAKELNRRILDKMLNVADVSLPSFDEVPHSLLTDTPLNDGACIEDADALPGLLQELQSHPDRCRAFDYVGALLVRSYGNLYTKSQLRSRFVEDLADLCPPPKMNTMGWPLRFPIFLILFPILSLPMLFPFLSASISLVLFMVAGKGQLYSQSDVTISYILLIGAIVLEVESLFMPILSHFAKRDTEARAFLRRAASRVANYVHPAGRHRKHWSEMLAQYNMIRTSLTTQDAAGVMSFVPQWISKHLDDKTVKHIPITDDLKKFVLDRLLHFGTGDQRDWNFASFRGQLALQRWTTMHKIIIHGADLPTNVLIWHIATKICYLTENSSTCSYQTNKIKVSRELSNYIMYLVFKCDVMLTSNSKLVHIQTCEVMQNFSEKHANLGEKEVIKMVFEANKGGYYQPADTDNHSSSSSSQPVTRLQLLENNFRAEVVPVLPLACAVAAELHGIRGDAHRWDLIAAVWLEMLFYIAPRCRGVFHYQHLSTGGEFITHVLFLMRELGPFLPLPGV